MKNKLQGLLCCPDCHGNLYWLPTEARCNSCKKQYKTYQGIHLFVDLEKFNKHYLNQINYFEREDSGRTAYSLSPWQERYVRNFLYHAPPRENGTILDNATGSGYMAIELAKRGFSVIATDLTLRELFTLRINVKNLGLTKDVVLVCCSSEKLPIRSESVDGLVANAILEHLPREKEAIKEITRVLKKGAPVMLAMPLSYRLLYPFLWLPNWIHDRRIGHLRRYSRESIIQKFRDFSEIATYYTGQLPKVVCLGLYFLTKRGWWLALGEKLDEKTQHIAFGASNVVSILRKNE